MVRAVVKRFSRPLLKKDDTMIEAVEINWKLLGAELANLRAKEQGEFFNGFIGEMQTWGTHTAREMQCIYIRNELDKKKREYIATIGWQGDDK